MGSKSKYDDQSAANLLRDFKAIATKEVLMIPPHRVDSFFEDSEEEFSCSSSEDQRFRTVSLGSVTDVVYSYSTTVTPILSFTPVKPLVGGKSFLLDDVKSNEDGDTLMEHHNWSRVEASPKSVKKISSVSMGHPLLTSSTTDIIKQYKKKRESFVGQTTSAKSVRATLRKKFSWKSYPELENFLLDNQEEYFKYSSRNYTPEQRKYNNGLTRGLLELASEEGYVFEDFTFSMVRDRIRCYYKSHSQSAKKKRKR